MKFNWLKPFPGAYLTLKPDFSISSSSQTTKSPDITMDIGGSFNLMLRCYWMMQVLNNATIEERNHQTMQALNERLVLQYNDWKT